MKLLTNDLQKSYKNALIYYICKYKFEDKHDKDKTYWKARFICKLKYSVPKEISTVFHNGYNYDYHFITKRVNKRILKTIYLFQKK